MSIVTRTGDDGTTGLMYNRRVSKSDARVEAYGTVDELNSALGVARAASLDPFIEGALLRTQKDLVILMGELATMPEDLPRYVADGFQVVGSDFTQKIEETISVLESWKISFHGWATPGGNPVSAALDLARTICRRAERRVCELYSEAPQRNPEIVVFLNRLSDCLWLLARWEETKGLPAPEPTRPPG